MVTDKSPLTADEFWDTLQEVYTPYHYALWRVLYKFSSVERLKLVRHALTRQGNVMIGFDIFDQLPVAERVALLDALVPHIYGNSPWGYRFIKMVLDIPREAVLPTIEGVIAAHLDKWSDSDDYGSLLYLLSQIDSDMTRRLAQRALDHDDPYIREFGQEYMDELNSKPGTD